MERADGTAGGRGAPELDRLLEAGQSNPAIIELLLSIHHGIDVARFSGVPALLSPMALPVAPALSASAEAGAE